MACSPSLSLCQLSTVGGTEWQVTAWASLSGQDDHSLPCSSQAPLAGLPPRLEGPLAWPGPAGHTCLCHAALCIVCAPGESSTGEACAIPLLEAQRSSPLDPRMPLPLEAPGQ